jgi:hypothetical protein
MRDERVWHVVGDDERSHRELLKRFVVVGAVAVVTGFGLSFAYSRSGAPPITRALAREAPADVGDSAAADAGEEPGRSGDDADEPDVSLDGEWQFTTHVRSATREQFEGLTLGYRLQLKQDGARVTGQGQKISENGETLGTRQRTPIVVEGEREGDRLMLKFTERGSRRASGGTFFLRLDDDRWRGTFASDAAGSKGDVSAERAESAPANPAKKSRAR